MWRMVISHRKRVIPSPLIKQLWFHICYVMKRNDKKYASQKERLKEKQILYQKLRSMGEQYEQLWFLEMVSSNKVASCLSTPLE